MGDLEAMFKYIHETDVMYYKTVIGNTSKNANLLSRPTSLPEKPRPRKHSKTINSELPVKKVKRRVQQPETQNSLSIFHFLKSRELGSIVK